MKAAIAIFHVIFLSALFFWVQRKWASQNKLLFWSALIFKMACAISIGLLYRFYYSSGDTWVFFREATNLATLAKVNFAEYINVFFSNQDTSTVHHILYVHDRSAIFIKLLSIFCLLSFNSYLICAIYFSFFSFLASWFLYRQVVALEVNSAKAAALALFFFPSIVFWSAGLMKETMALSSVYFILAIFLKAANRIKIHWIEWLTFLVSMALGWWLKYYWAALLLIVLFTSWWLILLMRRKPLAPKKFIFTWLGLFFLIAIAASFAHPNFYIHRWADVLVSNNYQFMLVSHPNNVINYYQLQPTWWSILQNSPWALFSGFFRPFSWEATNLLSVFYSIENLVLLFLAASFLFHWIANPQSLRFKTWMVPLFVYCVLLCILLSISTPNFGTLSRYRVGFLPAFVFVLLYRNPLFDYLSDRLLKW
jgi:hypothetical protein